MTTEPMAPALHAAFQRPIAMMMKEAAAGGITMTITVVGELTYPNEKRTVFLYGGRGPLELLEVAKRLASESYLDGPAHEIAEVDIVGVASPDGMYRVRPTPPPVRAWQVDCTDEQAQLAGYTPVGLGRGAFWVNGQGGRIYGSVGDWIVVADGQWPTVLTPKMFAHKYEPATAGSVKP